MTLLYSVVSPTRHLDAVACILSSVESMATDDDAGCACGSGNGKDKDAMDWTVEPEATTGSVAGRTGTVDSGSCDCCDCVSVELELEFDAGVGIGIELEAGIGVGIGVELGVGVSAEFRDGVMVGVRADAKARRGDGTGKMDDESVPHAFIIRCCCSHRNWSAAQPCRSM
jgi:hypothetical protein